MSGFRYQVRRDKFPGNQPRNRATFDRDFRRVLRLIVGSDKGNRASVGCEYWERNTAIEAAGQQARWASVRWDNCETVYLVSAVFLVDPLKIGDLLTVRTPGEMATVRTGIRGELTRSRTRASVYHEYIRVLTTIRIVLLIADECNPLAIRRPDCICLIEIVLRNLIEFLRSDIEQVNVIVLRTQIADGIFFEVIAIDHNRLGRLGFLHHARLCILSIRLEFLLQNQQKLLRIRRPLMLGNGV